MMNRTIYILPDACAVSEDNRLVEYLPSDPDAQSGDILIARIGRIMAGLECAFADIGRRKSGFLPLAENSSSFQGSAVRSGDLTVVQIRREENGTKGAFLSRDLSIPGEKVILMPMNRYIGVSNRITEPEERDRLRKIGQAVSGGAFGLVLRTSAVNADESSIREEAETLFFLWQGGVVYGRRVLPERQGCPEIAVRLGVASSDVPVQGSDFLRLAGELFFIQAYA